MCPVMMSAKSVETMLVNVLQICASIISLSWVGTGSLSSNRGPPTQHPFAFFFSRLFQFFRFFLSVSTSVSFPSWGVTALSLLDQLLLLLIGV